MRVAEDPLAQKLLVTSQLRLCIKPAPGVVEIDLAIGVEPAVVGRP